MQAAKIAKLLSRLLLAATYVVAFVAPVTVATANPYTITVGPEQPYVDWQVTFVEGDTLNVTVSTNVACDQFDFALTPDPVVMLLDESGNVDYIDDDGAHSETNCFASRLVVEEPLGTFTLRFTTYQAVYMQQPVPAGSWVVQFAQESWTPAPATTTTSTTTTTTTTSSTTLPPSTTTQPLATTTTTTAAPTTTSTTTVAPATTIPVAPVVTLPASTTSTTTTSSTTTVAPSTTTTVAPTTTTTTTIVASTTTTTSTTSTTTVAPTTTTTTTTTAAPTTTTVAPVVTLPPTTAAPTTTVPVTTTTTTVAPTTTTTTSSTTTTTTVPVTTTTQPPRLVEALAVVAAIPDEALAEAVVEVIAAEPEEITAADVLELVEQPTFDDLPQEQLQAVAVAINDADNDAKQVFEQAAADEMFSPALSQYQRSDSRINQEDRRTVVAVVAAGSALAVPRPASTTATIAAPTNRPTNRRI